jgi:hypothetical protein
VRLDLHLLASFTHGLSRFVKPGGYAEFVDFDVEYITPDNSLVPGSDVHNLNRMFIDQTRKMNIEPCPGKYLEKWMKAAGFEGVTATKRFLPLGTWPADKHLVSCPRGAGAVNPRLTRNRKRSAPGTS